MIRLQSKQAVLDLAAGELVILVAPDGLSVAWLGKRGVWVVQRTTDYALSTGEVLRLDDGVDAYVQACEAGRLLIKNAR